MPNARDDRHPGETIWRVSEATNPVSFGWEKVMVSGDAKMVANRNLKNNIKLVSLLES